MMWLSSFVDSGGVDPPPKRTGVWILWVISHPELVTEAEARAYDMVFVASKTWSPPGGVPSTPLLQATASDRFSPDAALPDSGAALLFVGSTRGQFRPAVRGALTSDRADELSVYGVGWEEFIEVDRISGEFLDNDQLPAAYAGAGNRVKRPPSGDGRRWFFEQSSLRRSSDGCTCGER